LSRKRWLLGRGVDDVRPVPGLFRQVGSWAEAWWRRGCGKCGPAHRLTQRTTILPATFVGLLDRVSVSRRFRGPCRAVRLRAVTE